MVCVCVCVFVFLCVVCVVDLKPTPTLDPGGGAGEYDRAIEYYERSLAIKLKTVGENHPGTAATYTSLGQAYKAKGEGANRGVGTAGGIGGV